MTLQTLLFHLQEYISEVLQIHILDKSHAILEQNPFMTCVTFFPHQNLHLGRLLTHCQSKHISAPRQNLCDGFHFCLCFYSSNQYYLIWVAMTPFLMFDRMIELQFSVRSAHLSYMNIVSVFEIPTPTCFRSLITICDLVFAKVVIDNKIWLNPGWL